MEAYHTDLAKNVARCRDSEVCIRCALKLANVDLGCLNVMASPSLFLHFFRQLVFPYSYLIRGTIPTSVLVLVENIFTPLYILPFTIVLSAVSYSACALLEGITSLRIVVVLAPILVAHVSLAAGMTDTYVHIVGLLIHIVIAMVSTSPGILY